MGERPEPGLGQLRKLSLQSLHHTLSLRLLAKVLKRLPNLALLELHDCPVEGGAVTASTSAGGSSAAGGGVGVGPGYAKMLLLPEQIGREGRLEVVCSPWRADLGGGRGLGAEQHGPGAPSGGAVGELLSRCRFW